MNFLNLQEKYLDGELTPEEKIEFQKLISENSIFREEIAVLNEIERTLHRKDMLKFDNILSEVEQEFFEHRRKKERKKTYKKIRLSPLGRRIAAASIIFLTAGSVFFLSSRKEANITSSGHLFDNYYSPYSIDIVKRGSMDKSEFDKWVLTYKDGNYQYFLANSPKIFETDYQQNMGLLLRGVATLEINKPQEARNILQKLAVGPDSLFTAHAKWYMALCYLKEGELDKTREILSSLIRDDRFYKMRAIELRKSLKKSSR